MRTLFFMQDAPNCQSSTQIALLQLETRCFCYENGTGPGKRRAGPPFKSPQLRLPHPFDYAQGGIFAIFEGWAFNSSRPAFCFR
jgi:hypothetical protein